MIEARLEETLRLAHGRLHVERANVLPLLLEKRDEEVDGQHGVLHDLVLLHVDVANGNGETENLLELELDGRLDVGDLAGKVVRVRDGGRELSCLGETGAEETRDLLDEGLGGKEGVVLLSELLDELLVLVELLQVLNSHEGELLVELLGTVNVHGVGENAELHTGTGDMGELDGTGETLVTLGVVVLEADLELNGLGKIALLGTLDTSLLGLDRGVVEDLADRCTHARRLELRHLGF